jgi:hypothetical protein
MAFVAGVLAFTGAAIAGTLSTAAHNPSAIGFVLGVAASLFAMAGGACLALSVVLAIAAAISRLWHLNRRIQGPAGRAESPHGPASPAGEPPR